MSSLVFVQPKLFCDLIVGMPISSSSWAVERKMRPHFFTTYAFITKFASNSTMLIEFEMAFGVKVHGSLNDGIQKVDLPELLLAGVLLSKASVAPEVRS